MKSYRGAMLVIFAYVCGAITYKYQLPPISLVKTIYTYIIYPLALEDKEDRQYNNTKLSGVISINDPVDLIAKKSRLVFFLWGSDKPPQSLPGDDG